jgi:hypothetical protein
MRKPKFTFGQMVRTDAAPLSKATLGVVVAIQLVEQHRDGEIAYDYVYHLAHGKGWHGEDSLILLEESSYTRIADGS